ncbi:hypothetical protein BpHYR1_002427 [Brachionus plicatilis]|uniref:Uncharacterized protein n=1 Tax=Brachionus plicatilis TaxID=10195 RepID=A0A3M7RPC0_BRAPC|nr:hypothetical protein BpHYR1_002427 [Brachionus plicatilis]
MIFLPGKGSQKCHEIPQANVSITILHFLYQNNFKNRWNKQLHSGVGYSMNLDSKPFMYSSTNLVTNGTEWLSSTPTYLSANSKSRLETLNSFSLSKASLCSMSEGVSYFSLRMNRTADF